MSGKNLPQKNTDDSDDDINDLDYIPSTKLENDDYEDDADDVSDDDIEHEIKDNNRKRKKREQEIAIKKNKTLNPVELKIRSEKLWSEFQNDINSSSSSTSSENRVEAPKPATPSVSDKTTPLLKTARNSGGGVANLLKSIGKKSKLSTLDKSRLDWDQFKQENNCKDELDAYKKGKNGYLEKQDFLQRADLRRFEIEKDLRNRTRKSLI